MVRPPVLFPLFSFSAPPISAFCFPSFCFPSGRFQRFSFQDFSFSPRTRFRVQSSTLKVRCSTSYPCRSMERGIKLVERFIAGVTKPACPSTQEDAANQHQYDGPPRTAEQVAKIGRAS